MPDKIAQAQSALEFLAPAFNPFVWQGVHRLLPIWMRSQTNIAKIEAENAVTLARFYQQFQAGKIRFLMAFRHPSADDPPCLLYLLSSILPQVAKKEGIKLKAPTHAHFIYDRGVPLWTGAVATWLYPRLGATPIHRGKLDRVGLRSARDLFLNGEFPMAAAPEGATNGHNEIVSPLEPGIAQMGFWCAEDLEKSDRQEQVWILPIGIQYRYLEAPWQQLDKLLTQLEVDCGLPVLETPTPESQKTLYQRLYRLGEHLLQQMEQFYTRFYHQKLAVNNSGKPLTNAEFADRLQGLLDAALQVAEQFFHIQPHGSLIDRCRRLEQAGWDCIYREDIKNPELISPLERSLANRIASEANLRMWHMRLVESFVAVTGAYVLEKPTAERFADTALIMWDTIARIKGGKAGNRPKVGRERVQITVGEPISVSDRYGQYQASRSSAKQAVTKLTQDLQTALEKTIS